MDPPTYAGPHPPVRGDAPAPAAQGGYPASAPSPAGNPAMRVGLSLPIGRNSGPATASSADPQPEVSLSAGCPMASAWLRAACESDLHFFHGKADIQPLKYDEAGQPEITKIKVFKDCIHGKVMRVRWNKVGCETVPVVAKRMAINKVKQNEGQERSERTAHWLSFTHPGRAPNREDGLTEIGVYSHLAKQADCSPWLLRMLACFQDQSHLHLCTENAEGGEVFDHVVALAQCGQRLSTQQILTHMGQLLHATSYLHSHHIAHRDISLENVLLKDGEFRLMDFGMAVRTHSAKGVPLRFFRASEKYYYRPPEGYVPHAFRKTVTPARLPLPGTIVQHRDSFEVLLPDDAVAGQACDAEVCGYEAMPLDVFACGVAFFILTWQNPPWQNTTPADQGFRFVSQRGVAALITAWKQPLNQIPEDAVSLLTKMVAGNPRDRPTAAESLSSPCFADFVAAAPKIEPPQNGSSDSPKKAASAAGAASSSAPANNVDVTKTNGNTPAANGHSDRIGDVVASMVQPDADMPDAGQDEQSPSLRVERSRSQHGRPDR